MPKHITLSYATQDALRLCDVHPATYHSWKWIAKQLGHVYDAQDVCSMGRELLSERLVTEDILPLRLDDMNRPLKPVTVFTLTKRARKAVR